MTIYNEKSQPSFFKRRLIPVVCLLVVLVFSVRLFASDEKKNGSIGAKQEQAAAVGVAFARKGDMPVVLNALGTVTPLASVAVKSKIGGELMRVAFEEGQLIQKGDFLAQIDPRPYQLALSQAEAQLARDQAALRDAELNLARYENLLTRDSISRQQRDTQAALVQQHMATVRADLAQIGTARLNLAYCRITSPLSGRIGLRKVDAGNYVQANGDTPLVTITQVQPITVLFSVPEADLPAIRRQLKDGASLEAEAFDRNQSSVLATGKVAAMDSQIDAATGTIKMRAEFANQDEGLYPNQFVNIRLVVDVQRDVTTIPLAAVQRGTPGTFVYLLKPSEGVVTVRPVKLGQADSERTVVLEGLEAGDTVVVDGADKLREGAKVSVAAQEEMPSQQESKQPEQPVSDQATSGS